MRFAPQETRTYLATAATAQRRSLFQVTATAELPQRTILDYRGQGEFLLHAFVIMPDHFHVRRRSIPASTVPRSQMRNPKHPRFSILGPVPPAQGQPPPAHPSQDKDALFLTEDRWTREPETPRQQTASGRRSRFQAHERQMNENSPYDVSLLCRCFRGK